MKSKYTTKEWETKIKKACKNNKSMASACASIGMNHNTFIAHAKRLNVYITNQGGKGISKPLPEKIELVDIIENGLNPQYTSSSLRKRLIKENIKEKKCEKCKATIWQGEDIPLELHHVDGNHHNHNIKNLMILCPNCHALTQNYSLRKS